MIGWFQKGRIASTLGVEGIEAIVLRTVGDQPSLFEATLPKELLRLPAELAQIDELPDDPVFVAPFVPFFDPRPGRPSTPIETLYVVDVPEVPVSAGLRVADAPDKAEREGDEWRILMTIYQAPIVRQLSLDESTPSVVMKAHALVPVPLPENWRDRPDFLRLHNVCLKHGYEWPHAL